MPAVNVEISPKVMKLSEHATKVAEKTIEWIENREPGWPLCKIHKDRWYTRPLWVSQNLKLSDAKDLYDEKVVGDPDYVPHRVYLTEWCADALPPQARFDPYRVHYSYNYLDWDRMILSAAEQAAMRQLTHGDYRAPRTKNEWRAILNHASNQSTVYAACGGKVGNRSPLSLLTAWHFVAPEVQLIPWVKSPHPNTIFELRYSERGRTGKFHFYNCYTAGVSQTALDQLLVGCSVLT